MFIATVLKSSVVFINPLSPLPTILMLAHFISNSLYYNFPKTKLCVKSQKKKKREKSARAMKPENMKFDLLLSLSYFIFFHFILFRVGLRFIFFFFSWIPFLFLNSYLLVASTAVNREL